jgi:hypothetical protein
VKAGVEDKNRFYGFTAIFVVSMAETANRTWWSATTPNPTISTSTKGDGTFDDQSYVSDFALNKDGREIASMGIAAGRLREQRPVDFFVTDFGDDYKVLYHNDGDASFTDVSYKAGIAQTTIPFVGWGDGFHRLRQRWLARPVHGQRPRLSPGGSARLGHHLSPSGRCSFTTYPIERQGTQIRIRPAGYRYRAGGGGSGARRCLRRPVQRWQDRRGHQSHRRPAGTAAQRQPRPSSLGRDRAGGWTEEPTRRHLRHGISHQANGMRQRQDVLASGSYISSRTTAGCILA